MSAHVLLNLYCSASLLFLNAFHNMFNKFNNTGTQMFDSIYMYHMAFKLIWKWHFLNYFAIRYTKFLLYHGPNVILLNQNNVIFFMCVYFKGHSVWLF